MQHSFKSGLHDNIDKADLAFWNVDGLPVAQITYRQPHLLFNIPLPKVLSQNPIRPDFSQIPRFRRVTYIRYVDNEVHEGRLVLFGNLFVDELCP
jgi:hypothetical protein